MAYQRQPEAEVRRLASLPRGKAHWNWQPKAKRALVIHKRIHRWFGPARNYCCVDCGRQAYDWSFLEVKGFDQEIGLYLPRCRGCHVKKDKNWIKKP